MTDYDLREDLRDRMRKANRRARRAWEKLLADNAAELADTRGAPHLLPPPVADDGLEGFSRNLPPKR